jgi:hypothetical protein
LFLRGALVSWIDGQSVPYAVKGGEWVGFDNQDSYDAKVSQITLIWIVDMSIQEGLDNSSFYLSNFGE